MNKRKNIIQLVTGFLGSMLGLFGVNAIYTFILMSLPIGVRLIVMPVSYWLIAIVPVIIIIISKGRLSEYGFSKEKICIQILTGIVIGLFMSAILTFIPHLAGFGEYVNNGKQYKYLWQFVFEFVYCIFAIGCVEEIVFRGFIYRKIANVFAKDIIAIIGSSILFGVFHLLSGSIVQMIMTAFIGIFFCFIRNKIKNCTTMSLIIAHGIYDALITVMTCIMTK